MPLDIVIVGGGLSGALTAWRLRQRHPSLRLRLIEADDWLGGNHTWSVFASDLSPEQRKWLDPVMAHCWSGYEVRFPRLRWRLATPYMSATSERLAATVAAALGDAVVLGSRVTEVARRHVRLATGESIEAEAVLDARGLRSIRGLLLGYQKFVGLQFSAPAAIQTMCSSVQGSSSRLLFGGFHAACFLSSVIAARKARAAQQTLAHRGRGSV